MDIKADEYTYRVFWSDEDEGYVATVAEFPSLSHIADHQQDALSGLVGLVGNVLSDMAEAGKLPPIPLGRRRFSGKFPLRMTPEQHRRAAIEAAEAHVSINQLLVSRI